MTTDEVIKEVRAACDAVGGLRAWARKIGVSATYVSDVLRGRREPAGKILTALNLKRVVVVERVVGYERIEP